MSLRRSHLLKISPFFIFGAVITFFPGCECPWSFCKKTKPRQVVADTKSVSAKGSGAVLAEVRGKPVIMESAFNDKLRQMLQANAYTKDIDPGTVPAEAKIKFLNDWLNVVVIKEVWGVDNKVKESSDFRDELASRMEALEDALIVEKFVGTLRGELAVSDNDISREFNDNKERYTKVAGGVRVAGAKFSDKEKAQLFVNEVGAKNISNFEKAAKENKDAEYRDFGRISDVAFRGAPNKLAKKALATATFPEVGFVEVGDKEFWVFLSLDKKDSEFYNLDEVKPQIKAMLEEKHFGELLNARLEKFKEVSSVKVNEEYFRK
ncbi:hypothetical protein KAU11_01905 [Candidatus Babeliales bacterium]|nr:hypothetical protein [Candidatus Babeliales bacterium]